MSLPRYSLSFFILDQLVSINCPDSGTFDLLAANFRGMASTAANTAPALTYEVMQDANAFALLRNDIPLNDANDLGDLLFFLEKDLTVELQKRRADLYFLHAGAVERGGKVFLLLGPSGAGKSSTTWGLLHEGFQYLTDELTALDLGSMRAYPYAHALCLKDRLPCYPLPPGTIDLGRTLHIPVQCLPSSTVSQPRALAAAFLVHYRAERPVPKLHALGRAESAARLYVNSLNALAHRNAGLEGVARIASHVPCFAVDASDLRATCRLIGREADAVLAG